VTGAVTVYGGGMRTVLGRRFAIKKGGEISFSALEGFTKDVYFLRLLLAVVVIAVMIVVEAVIEVVAIMGYVGAGGE
jgi:hypothetical protein